MMEQQQGLCYNCDEQCTHGHKCQKLFYLEVADFDEEVSPEPQQHKVEKPLISLQVVSGVRSTDTLTDTLQVHVQVGDNMFTTLIDNGSTHNFFSNNAAAAVGLQFQQDIGARVIVANGDCVPCGGLLCDVDIKNGQEIFTNNAYTLPLDYFDMVLGVDFLKPLNSIRQ
jgi:hypothetical protein